MFEFSTCKRYVKSAETENMREELRGFISGPSLVTEERGCSLCVCCGVLQMSPACSHLQCDCPATHLHLAARITFPSDRSGRRIMEWPIVTFLHFLPNAQKMFSGSVSLDYQTVPKFAFVYFSIPALLLPFSKIVPPACQTIHCSLSVNFSMYLLTSRHTVLSTKTMPRFFGLSSKFQSVL